jgi:hypothetical protein
VARGNSSRSIQAFSAPAARVSTSSGSSSRTARAFRSAPCLSFPDGASVTTYFGPGSRKTSSRTAGPNLGSGYFGGFTNSSKKPASILFAQYNKNAVGAYLRGGDVSALTLTQLQAISGSLSIVIDGVTKSGSPNLSAATSFSSAAQSSPTCSTSRAAPARSLPARSRRRRLPSRQYLRHAARGRPVRARCRRDGRYLHHRPRQRHRRDGHLHRQRVADRRQRGDDLDRPGVTYDSVSGGFVVASSTTGATSTIAFATGTIAASLKLTSATGAVLSQGAIAAVPAAFMDALVVVNSNWVTFMTTFDPDGERQHGQAGLRRLEERAE